MTDFSDSQRASLRAICDTFVPAIEMTDDPDGFWARRASDIGADAAVEKYIDTHVEPAAKTGLLQLLDVFTAQDFASQDQATREGMIEGFKAFGPEVTAGIQALQSLTLLHTYGMAPEGGNPNWKTTGYPGPIGPPPDVPKPIRLWAPKGDEATLDADACIVGSGAGGGVIAGVLAQAGKKVVVLEAGGYYNEADFNSQELWAYENLYYKGGLPPTADGNVTLMCGTGLGGGTTVNWQNCIRTPDHVRAEWEREHGLEGLAGGDYDRHLDSVLERIKANDECSDHNDYHLRLQKACDKLGFEFKRLVRNTDPQVYDPASAGYVHFGDQTGGKQGTLKTFLQDAHDNGATIVARCKAERVLVEDGQAVGVAATCTAPDGRESKLMIRAPQVVVACGALESPALLLRSGIGGPACGRYLRLHPGGAISGLYDEVQNGWWGAPQSGLSDSFANLEDGHGFLIECPAYSPGLAGAVVPWLSGRDHKERMASSDHSASFVFLIRDRGHGQVTIDESGEAVQTYLITDELDQRNYRTARETLVRLHDAAGANEIGVSGGGRLMTWKRGEDLDSFIAEVNAVPFTAGSRPLFSAHQMGSCRMGRDPDLSVCDPTGELHDTAGVWIGDGSALPTAPGSNPMITIMAMAHRTAEAMLAGSRNRTRLG